MVGSVQRDRAALPEGRQRTSAGGSGADAADDFHIGPRLSHCGVDAVTLFATSDGWKIAGIHYTVTEAAQCPPSPLGPPDFK